MSRRILLASLVVAVASSLIDPAARADEQAIEKGVAAAEDWLTLVDRGEYDKSWQTTAALFRAKVARENWVQTISKIRRPLGKRVFRKVILTKYETQLPGAPEGQYVIVQFKTLFENGAQVTETVTPMMDPDGQWRVSGYYIK